MVKTKTSSVRRTAFKVIPIDISLVEYSKEVEEDFNISDAGVLYFSLNLSFSISKKTGLIDILLSYKFNAETTLLFSIKTKSTYKVSDVNKGALSNENSRQDVLLQLTEGLINHTRGIQAYLLRESFLKKYFIPQIDRKQLSGIVKSSNQDHVDE